MPWGMEDPTDTNQQDQLVITCLIPAMKSSLVCWLVRLGGEGGREGK